MTGEPALAYGSMTGTVVLDGSHSLVMASSVPTRSIAAIASFTQSVSGLSLVEDGG